MFLPLFLPAPLLHIESGFNFSHYLNRFSMPSFSTPHWYSWDIGPVHFLRSVCALVSVQLRSHHCVLNRLSLTTTLPLPLSPFSPPDLLSYSTEVYFYEYFAGWGIKEQLAWLEEDLATASSPENRQLRPWIITYGHRPMYCSNLDGDDCTTRTSVVRAGSVLATHCPQS